MRKTLATIIALVGPADEPAPKMAIPLSKTTGRRMRMLADVMQHFPTICQVADDGKIFQSDIAAVAAVHAANRQDRAFVDAFEESKLTAKDLMRELSFPVAAPRIAGSEARQLEIDLLRLVPVVGVQRLRAVFRDKLLARKSDQWVDTIHEIAVTATSIDFYDPSTLELEKSIPGTANNSDLYGLRGGTSFRIDATVAHDQWPPPSDIDVEEVKAYSRSTMARAEMDDLTAMNPPGVVTLADIKTDTATHTEIPLSTKVWQALDKKRRQCEPGCVNVIAIGLPRPLIDDHGTEDAVLGSVHAIVTGATGATELRRHGTGPFVPAESSIDAGTWVNPFRVMSGIWMLRWNAGYPLSRVHPNPNAATLLDCADAEALMTLGMNRATRV
jgi:hypothetical protein